MFNLEEDVNTLKNLPTVNWPVPYYQVAKSRALVEGIALEFGVSKGYSITFLSTLFDEVHGFDTFTGLPDYKDSRNSDYSKIWRIGQFSNNGQLPEVPSNVFLYKGLIQDTLEPFLQKYIEPIQYINIDVDIYSSAYYILDTLFSQKRIVPGTIITFDEFWGFSYYEDHEIKAWGEIVNKYNVEYSYLFTTDKTRVAAHQNGQRPKIGCTTLIVK